MDAGQIRRWQTVVQNLRSARQELPEGLKVWAEEVEDWRPDVVISDFEPVSAGFARWARTPLIAVDNINVIDRCRHGRRIIGAERDEYLIARALVRGMVPGAAEYVVTTFFRPPLARKRTTLVPPILRPEIASARGEDGEHLVVYWGGEEKLLEALRRSGVRCLVYGMRGGPDEVKVEGNLEFRPPSNEGFVEALRTCRGVVAGGGFSLLSEAVYLGKPVLSVPLRGQFEQLMNARYLQARRYGLCAEHPGAEVLRPLPRGAAELPPGSEELSPGRQRRRPEDDRGASRGCGGGPALAGIAPPAAAQEDREVRRAAIGALGALGAAAGAAVYNGQVPTSQLYGRTICRVPEAGRAIALTYDDGPNPATPSS